MKSILIKFILFLTGIMLMNSCMVIEKRYYTKEFYIDRLGGVKKIS